MSAEAFFDTENLFRGISPRETDIVNDERRTARNNHRDLMDRVVFGGERLRDEFGREARVWRLFDDILTWFRVPEQLGEPLTQVTSFGKLTDPSVDMFLCAIEHVRFPHHRHVSPVTVMVDDTTVVHHNVGIEPDAGEDAMVRVVDVRQAQVDSIVIGCGDKRGIGAVDHRIGAGLLGSSDVWVLMNPDQEWLLREFEPHGLFPNIPHAQVFLLSELSSLARARWTDFERERARVRNKRIRPLVDALVGKRAVPQDLALDIIALLAVHWDDVVRHAPSSKEWQIAVGNSWLAALLASADHGSEVSPERWSNPSWRKRLSYQAVWRTVLDEHPEIVPRGFERLAALDAELLEALIEVRRQGMADTAT